MIKKFTHFNYFGASCRYAGEWTVIHLSVHICFLASTFFTNIPARSQTSSHGHFTHQVLTLSQLHCTRVPIMSTATAIDAKVSFDPQPTRPFSCCVHSEKFQQSNNKSNNAEETTCNYYSKTK